MTAQEFEVGDTVTVKGRRGVFMVKGHGSDGSVLLFGGDKNPNGKQGYRSVLPERLERSKK